MIVSWNWLKEYVPLAITPDELTDRLMMAGLNHESTEAAGSDFAIDLEITSNRPDCLGHIGIAREAAVLLAQPLATPDPRPQQGATSVVDLTRVSIECKDLCHRYDARVIRGVKIGSSPAWLADRLRTIGQPTINNVVDITNYVLMECGQPLHAFDLAKLAGRQIIVRRAKAGEQFAAIDHKTYALDSEMCVIADAQRPVALGGVMGGADSEVSPSTKELLIEAAQFAPMSIRSTARKLKLHSPSSYRFERGTDPGMVDWASRRCCELILNIAGGELAEGVIQLAPPPPARSQITLRLSQLKRILGIEVPAEIVRRILTALGCSEQSATASEVITISPSWRRDLDREIDLVEEVARVYGYDKIPEDASVPMAPSHRPDRDRVLAKVRSVLTAAGCDEAVTASVVAERWTAAFSPWTDAAPLVANTPLLEGADRLRCSLVPSLLEVRRINESLSNPLIELFETAKIYLPTAGGLPVEQWTLAAVSGNGFLQLKGIVEGLLAALHIAGSLELVDFRHDLLAAGQASELKLAGKRLGFLGDVSASGLKAFGLRGSSSILELDLSALAAQAVLIPKYAPQSPYPTISRDINLIVAESIRWADLAGSARTAAGPTLERLEYLDDTYRDPSKDGPDTKRLLFSLTLRPADRTLTSTEADAIRDAVVAACTQQHGAKLLS